MNKETIKDIDLASNKELRLFIKFCKLAEINIRMLMFINAVTFNLFRERLERQAEKIVVLLSNFWDNE